MTGTAGAPDVFEVAFPGWTVRVWSPTSAAIPLLFGLVGDAGEARRHSLATWAILGEDAEPHAVAARKREIRALADEIDSFIRGAAVRILRDERRSDGPACVKTPAGPVLWLDAVGAEILEELGTAGAKAAARMREAAAVRWAVRVEPGAAGLNLLSLLPAWLQPEDPIDPTPWAANVAKALWLDRVKKRLEMQQHTPPGLPLLELERLMEPMHAAATVRGIELVSADDRVIEQLVTPRREGAVLADLETLEHLRDRGFQHMASVNGPRALVWMVTCAWESFWEQSESERDRYAPVYWLIEGGWEEVAADVYRRNGLPVPRDLRSRGREFRAIFSAFAHRPGSGPRGESSGMLLFDTMRRAWRGQSPITRFVAADSLLPFSVRDLPEATRAERPGRWVAPVVVPPLPVGNERHFHGQALLAQDLVIEMVRRRGAVVRDGGLRDPAWAIRSNLAGRAGLDARRLREAWAAWRDQGFIEEPEPGLVQLGPARGDAWEAIKSAGARSRQRSADGTKGNQRRHAGKRARKKAE